MKKGLAFSQVLSSISEVFFFIEADIRSTCTFQVVVVEADLLLQRPLASQVFSNALGDPYTGKKIEQAQEEERRGRSSVASTSWFKYKMKELMQIKGGSCGVRYLPNDACGG